MPKSITILILAAGASIRMDGEIKQLLPWGSSTLLENAVNQATGLTENVYVVLGAYADEILESVSLNAEVIVNSEWQAGMGSSISFGLQHILKKENPDALLMMVVDQPLIDTTFISQLSMDFTKNECKITATTYSDGAGVPAIFDNSLFSELKDLHSDFGARKIIKKYEESLNLVDAAGKEVDVDTREKYNQITGKQYFKNE
ncbi:nucleotidyltransferase family protein [Flagellimonas sp. 2504JD1-5]